MSSQRLQLRKVKIPSYEAWEVLLKGKREYYVLPHFKLGNCTRCLTWGRNSVAVHLWNSQRVLYIASQISSSSSGWEQIDIVKCCSAWWNVQSAVAVDLKLFVKCTYLYTRSHIYIHCTILRKERLSFWLISFLKWSVHCGLVQCHM